MIKIAISEEEKTLLKKYLKTTPLLLIRSKCQNVIANIQRDMFAETKNAFAGRVKSRKFEYRI